MEAKEQELCKDGLPCDNPTGMFCRCTKLDAANRRKKKADRKRAARLRELNKK
jgi:hypothetical protein